MTEKTEGFSWTRLHRLLTLAAISFLLLAFGVVVGATNHQALTINFHGFASALNADQDYKWWWLPVRYQKSGVVRHDPSRAYKGVTFYVSAGRQDAYLVDMDGTVLHKWSYPFSRLASQNSSGLKTEPDPDTHWDGAYLFPNGDVLAIYRKQGLNIGMVRIDKNSKLIWFSDLAHHHAPNVGPDGMIYTLTNRVRDRRVPIVGTLEPPILEDFVTIMQPSGEVVREISIIDAFVRSDYQNYLLLARNLKDGDSYHANKVEVVPEGLAHMAPFLKAGNLVVSLREIHTIAILDPEQEKIVWAVKGPWFFQHDPEVMPNGNILLFDNRGDTSGWGESRAIEFDPLTHAVVWSYTGTKERPLFSFIRSGVQRLPNGNTLVIESDGGRIIEVTPGKEIVWEYVNPDRRKMDVERISAIGLNATRFAREDLPFLKEIKAARR